MSRLKSITILGVVFTLALAGTASAVTTVSRSGTTITITGGDEVNYVEQQTYGDSGPLLYRDPAGINFGEGCADAGTGNTVQCGSLGPGLVANVSLGGGDDTFRPEYIITTSPRLVVDLGAGNDTSWGSGLNDDLRGGAGDDTIIAMDGSDAIDGGAGKDRLTGSSGDDTITGGPGADSLFGDGEYSGFSYGNDTLNARDGEADALSCSFGADTAVADGSDVFDVLGDCESRDIGSASPGPAPGGGTLAVRLGAPSGTRLAQLVKGKALSFKLTVSGACTAAAAIVVRKAEARRLKLGIKDTTVAKDAAAVPEAGTYTATLKLLRKYRAKLRRATRVTAYLVVACAGADGSAPLAARKVVLRR